MTDGWEQPKSNLRQAAQQALEALEKLDEQELATGEIAWLGKEIGDLIVALADTQDLSEVEALRESLCEHMAEIHRLRVAGQQALEALEGMYLNVDAKRIYTDGQPQKIVDVINALRAALSENTTRSDRTVYKEQWSHIKELYSVDEIRKQIDSNYYSAELLLQHAMLHLMKLEPVTGCHELRMNNKECAAAIRAKDEE